MRRDKLWTKTSHYAHHPQALGNHVYAVETAFVYWFDIANIHDLAISADATVKAVTRKVNGGQNGYQARLNAFNRLADYLGLTKASQ